MTIFIDRRAGAFVWLIAAASVAALGYWYPMFVAERNASEDDRFGWALLVGLPFVFLGSVVAIWNYVRLLKALTKAPRGSVILGLLGGLLLLVSISAAVMLALRLEGD